MKPLRFALAAFVSGTASWVLPLLLIAFGFATDTGYDKLGRPDDAPARAGFALLLLSPLFILGMSVFYALLGGVLRLANRESLRAFIVVSGLVASLISIVFAYDGFFIGGAADAVISFSTLGIISFISLALGSLAWVRYVP